MINDPVLLNEWHVVARSEEIPAGKPFAARLLDEDVVVWRIGDQLMAWQDLCIHRGTKLSLGQIENDTLTCPYHGWVYNTEGKCIKIPAHPEQIPPIRARVKPYRVIERYGWVWVSLGEPTH